MRLNVSNFAKIKSADIVVDGITVIAGDNNTGKSTIGKILFSLFNAVSGIEDKILEQKVNEIAKSSRTLLRNSISVSGNERIRNAHIMARKIADRFEDVLEKQYDIDSALVHSIIEEVIIGNLPSGEKTDCQSMIDDISGKVTEILMLSEYALVVEVLTSYFGKVFHGQINSLNQQNNSALLNLTVKNKNVSLSFEGNECTQFVAEISLLNKAIYVDDPFVVDKLSSYNDLYITEEFLRNLISDGTCSDVMSGLVRKVLVKERMSEIYQTLESVVDGLVVQKNEEYFLQNESFAQPISFKNLSTGLKSFVIIKMLVENGVINEKDVLILDEPEIHLHPQWQVAYAELIVLLQKYFDLSIVVTTHSPYFLDAIDLFSVKHGLKARTNYYLSSMENNEVEMVNVTDNIELIYQKMASPIQMLDSLRHELNNN